MQAGGAVGVYYRTVSEMDVRIILACCNHVSATFVFSLFSHSLHALCMYSGSTVFSCHGLLDFC